MNKLCIKALLLLLLSTGPLLAQDTTLQAGQSMERAINSGQTHKYPIELAAGQFLKLRMELKGIAIIVTIYSPDGQSATKSDSAKEQFGKGGLALIATTTGQYQIEVRASEQPTKTGRYALLVGAPRLATETDREYLAGEQAYTEGTELYQQRTGPARQQALAKFQAALLHWQAAKEQAKEAETLSAMGGTWLLLGEAKQALTHYLAALALYQAVADHEEEVVVMCGAAQTYAMLGQLPQAIELADRALPLSRTLSNPRYEAGVLGTLAFLHRSRGDAQKAREYLRQMLPVLRASGDQRAEVTLLSTLGQQYQDLGEPLQAMGYQQQALALKRSLGLNENDFLTIHRLAELAYGMGELQQAANYYQQALPLTHQSGNRRLEAEMSRGLGRVYFDLGDVPQATVHFQQALTLSRAVADPSGEAASLQLLSLVQMVQQEWAQALALAEPALALYRKLKNRPAEASALLNLGDIQLGLGERQKALTLYQEALAQEGGLPRVTATILLQMGAIHIAQGEWQTAAAQYQQALEIGRATKSPRLETEALRGLALLAFQQGDYPQAQSQIEAAINRFETTRSKVISPDLRLSYRSTTQGFYDLWIETLMRQHQQHPNENFAARAFQANEQARARTLLELLVEARADIRQGADPDLLKQERVHQQLLSFKDEQLAQLLANPANQPKSAKLATELDQLRAEYRGLAERLRAASPNYAALTQPPPFSAADIQQQVLDAETLLLEYRLGEKQSYLFAVTRTEVLAFTLPGRAAIETVARAYHAALSRYEQAKTYPTAAAARKEMTQTEAQLAHTATQLKACTKTKAPQVNSEDDNLTSNS